MKEEGLRGIAKGWAPTLIGYSMQVNFQPLALTIILGSYILRFIVNVLVANFICRACSSLDSTRCLKLYIQTC